MIETGVAFTQGLSDRPHSGADGRSAFLAPNRVHVPFEELFKAALPSNLRRQEANKREDLLEDIIIWNTIWIPLGIYMGSNMQSIWDPMWDLHTHSIWDPRWNSYRSHMGSLMETAGLRVPAPWAMGALKTLTINFRSRHLGSQRVPDAAY